MTDDETQHSSAGRRFARGPKPSAWTQRIGDVADLLRRWFTGAASRDTMEDKPDNPAYEHLSVHEILRALPTLLDGAALANGVVELLVEDFEAPWSQLFDIHDGHVKLLSAGECVPWASIAGPPTAWAMALGAARDTTRLQLTGDKPLARRVLAALPRRG